MDLGVQAGCGGTGCMWGYGVYGECPAGEDGFARGPPTFPAGEFCCGTCPGSPPPSLLLAGPSGHPEPSPAGIAHPHQHHRLLPLCCRHPLHPPALLLLQVELCHAMLCMPRCAVPCYTLPCCVMIHRTVPHCAMQCRAIRWVPTSTPCPPPCLAGSG